MVVGSSSVSCHDFYIIELSGLQTWVHLKVSINYQRYWQQGKIIHKTFSSSVLSRYIEWFNCFFFQMKVMQVRINYINHRKFVLLSSAFVFFSFAFLTMLIPLYIFVKDIHGFYDKVISPSYAYTLFYMCIFILQLFYATLAVDERFTLMNNLLR